MPFTLNKLGTSILQSYSMFMFDKTPTQYVMWSSQFWVKKTGIVASLLPIRNQWMRDVNWFTEVTQWQFYDNIWYVQQGERPVLPASIVQYGIWTSSINAVNIQEKERSGKCEHTIRRRSVSRETEEYKKEKRTGKVDFWLLTAAERTDWQADPAVQQGGFTGTRNGTHEKSTLAFCTLQNLMLFAVTATRKIKQEMMNWRPQSKPNT